MSRRPTRRIFHLRPSDLLTSAENLVPAGRGRPLESDLRRAVSTVYYALFHGLAECCADELFNRNMRGRPGWVRIYRGLNHRRAREACRIDEYDNFANTILASRGPRAYESFTHGGGFFCSIFSTLKAGAGESGGGIERLFITGVSPITMDDVTSGFNIGANISLEPDFNEMLGFTDSEVRGLLELYRERGAFDQDVDAAMDVMREWYNGYRFGRNVATDVYNTDMVLYYLEQSVPNKPGPDDLIDVNVRIDYGKLRHLMTVQRDAGLRLNGNFDLLRGVAGEGEVDAEVNASFPLQQLGDRDNFLSLLYYFGLLSVPGTTHGRTRLGIRNQTVRRLLYGQLRDAWKDVRAFSADQYQYLSDEGLRRYPASVRHVGLALVFHGWELVASEAVEPA